jgi:hypothetical protein
MGSSKRHQTKQRSMAERSEAAAGRGVVGNDGYGGEAATMCSGTSSIYSGENEGGNGAARVRLGVAGNLIYPARASVAARVDDPADEIELGARGVDTEEGDDGWRYGLGSSHCSQWAEGSTGGFLPFLFWK